MSSMPQYLLGPGVFAGAYVRIYHRIDRALFHEVRKALMRRLQGAVLEIGSGTGLNFPYLPDEVTYIGIEPESAMMRHARRAGFPHRLLLATGERLPFKDGSFDGVVSTFSLCSVRDPLAVAREAARVLKPEGAFFFLEHVRSRKRSWAAIQDFLTPLWSKVLRGCHLNRPLQAILEEAGLHVDELHEAGGAILPLIWGAARLRGAKARSG